jgi:tetratricopeptide (TPR) repeat protein
VQKNQFILIGIGLILVATLYLFSQRKNTKHDTQAGHQHEATAMSGAQAKEFDFQKYQSEALAKLSVDDNKKAVAIMEFAEKNNTAVAQKDVAEFWEGRKDLNMAAHFYKKGAFLENTEKSVTFAGNLFLALMQRAEEADLRKWHALEAISCFNKSLELQPENADVKIALATCYTEGTGETMKGVTLLREVTQTDSTNISANIILGKLAIQSGQFDKAIKRLELVLSLRPENSEAMYFLAEAYKGVGNKEKAIALFEQCKKIVNNPDFTKEVDQYINSFK